MFYGLDVHKEFIQVCRISVDGKDRQDWRISATPKCISTFAKDLTDRDEVVLEATFHTWALYGILTNSQVKRVRVANSYQVKAIASARIKTDKIDAHMLAQLLRADLIPEVHLPDEQVWESRQLVSHRRFITDQIVAVKNSIWGIVNKKLLKCPFPSLFRDQGVQWLKAQSFTPVENLIVENLLGVLDQLQVRIQGVDQKLAELGGLNPNVRLLMTIPGVSLGVASGLASSIGEIARFDSPQKLASYFGLVPRISQSANRCHYGGITKAGRTLGRWLAVEAAQNIARMDTPLATTFHRIKRKKGHNVAITALARKLIVLSWHMLKENQPYRYASVQWTRQKLKAVTPTFKRARAGERPTTLEAMYKEMKIPELNKPSAGEKKAQRKRKQESTCFST